MPHWALHRRGAFPISCIFLGFRLGGVGVATQRNPWMVWLTAFHPFQAFQRSSVFVKVTSAEREQRHERPRTPSIRTRLKNQCDFVVSCWETVDQLNLQHGRFLSKDLNVPGSSAGTMTFMRSVRLAAVPCRSVCANPCGGPRCPKEPSVLARCCRELARELQSPNQQGPEEVRWDGDFRCCWALRVSCPSLVWHFSATCSRLWSLAHECQHCPHPGCIPGTTFESWLARGLTGGVESRKRCSSAMCACVLPSSIVPPMAVSKTLIPAGCHASFPSRCTHQVELQLLSRPWFCPRTNGWMPVGPPWRLVGRDYMHRCRPR